MVSTVPTPDQTLAAVLRYLRQKRGITQEELAFSSNVTVSALSRIERGRSNPVWTTLVQIAEALDMTPAELIAIAEDARTRERAAMN
jgi:transcriptional regulator with XRE-family HTH domain